MHRTCRPAPAGGTGGALIVKFAPLVLTMGNLAAATGSGGEKIGIVVMEIPA
jgi:hypothetical protein